MKRFWICLLLILTLCTSIACQNDPPPKTPDVPDDPPTSRYRWEAVSFPAARSSGVNVKIEDTMFPSCTYEQLYNFEVGNDIQLTHMYEFDDTCIVEYLGDGDISDSAESFEVKFGIGLPPAIIRNTELELAKTVDRVVVTLTINGNVFPIVETTTFTEDNRNTLIYGIPVFDEIEGKVTHAYRFRYPVAGTANVPLSLFDFSESDTVEVSVSAIFYDGEEVLPISLNPCTFQLKKQTHGFAFIGTDSSIHGYRVEEIMIC